MTWCAYITTPSAHCQSHSESETFANFIVGSKNFRGGVWLFLPKDEMRKSVDRCPKLGAPTLWIATVLKWTVVKPMQCNGLGPEKLALRWVYTATLTLRLKNTWGKAPFSHKSHNLRQRRWSRPWRRIHLTKTILFAPRGATYPVLPPVPPCGRSGELNGTSKAATLQRNTHQSLYLQRGQNGWLNLYNVLTRLNYWLWRVAPQVSCALDNVFYWSSIACNARWYYL